MFFNEKNPSKVNTVTLDNNVYFGEANEVNKHDNIIDTVDTVNIMNMVNMTEVITIVTEDMKEILSNDESYYIPDNCLEEFHIFDT
ncbi:hypothetical protein RhiirA5_412959 [Rhizophagus irregularis]|uniref:Uncharacterized protein n=1 Tax=Rhizophagus irregularis TaxID=588596 RepID=A0A2I1E5Q5_9GLOM|nr:hypothetical protein RhiirA5_412959 [Rhizophagus irregularis]PKC76493.1 hypothetical protein RhiirA1_447549 [Rhizophagus irregularis]PKY17453.1 hypothetical protein RhiirB3_430085 [Rhizophagus irregularis]